MDSNTISLYHTFLVVAESPSISAAAKALYISQPAVSKSIQRLENILNVKLINRSSRGIQLTNEGQIFYEYLHSAFETISAGEDTLRHINELGIGHIRIGASSTLCKHILLPCLKEFIALHPHIQITIECQSTIHTIELLENKDIDLGLIALPDDNRKLNCIPVGTLNDIFVSTPQYLTGLQERELQELEPKKSNFLNHANLILLDKKNVTRRYIDRFLNEWSIDTENAMEVNSMEMLIDFVKTGLGAGCVIKEFVNDELASGQLIELSTPSKIPQRHIGFAYSSVQTPSTATQMLIEFINRDL